MMSGKTESNGAGGKPNRLISEKSPYLLQHAYSPVDWHPWGYEAFEKAREEDKPIFLSIGYSSCHWCHVMGRESFEDPEVARLMNEVFISIKVDREERPDIDNVYMTVCHMMTGSGGWPLTIIMTPGKIPFFAGTYLPKHGRFGQIGVVDMIDSIREVWATRREEVTESTRQVIAVLQQETAHPLGEELDEEALELVYEQLVQGFDEHHGGFGSAPKFPTPQNILFLLRYWKRTGNEKSLEMAEQTLRAMQCGGIYDHVGFGFHRYSTDPEWFVPHFEKMLCDQAMMAMAYTEAYQATRKEEYRETARKIFTYVLRDMTSREGAFYSAEDADSEGEEGKFYLWTLDEIRQTLEDREADLAIDLFNVRNEGNFFEQVTSRRTGSNILHLKKPIDETASDMEISGEELGERLETVYHKLFNAREKRIHPRKDDKILTDWNGLMISALAKSARVFDEAEYEDAAKRAADFVIKNMCSANGRLLHRYRDGQAAIPASIDDYAFFIWGLIELYETTFDLNYLQKALDLNRHLIEHYWDNENGGFYFTADDSEELITRRKEIHDGALPSGNSAAMMNLLLLGRISADSELEEKAAEISRAFSANVKQSPLAHVHLMVAADFSIGPSYEVTISGDPRTEDTRAMLKTLRKHFIPNKVVLMRPIEREHPDITQIARFTEDMSSINRRATAYVCNNYNCERPTTNVSKMLGLLDVG